jgi:hypothetical protein
VSQNVIELNGKRYDALNGAFLGKSDAPAPHTSTPRRQGSSGRVIDGFIRPSAKPAAVKPAAKAAKTPAEHATHHVPAAAKATHAVTHHVPRTEPSHKPMKSIAPALVKAAGHNAAPAAAEAKTVPTAKQHHAGHTHVHQKAKEARRHQPEHSKTLMRRTVIRPARNAPGLPSSTPRCSASMLPPAASRRQPPAYTAPPEPYR